MLSILAASGPVPEDFPTITVGPSYYAGKITFGLRSRAAASVAAHHGVSVLGSPGASHEVSVKHQDPVAAAPSLSKRTRRRHAARAFGCKGSSPAVSVSGLPSASPSVCVKPDPNCPCRVTLSSDTGRVGVYCDVCMEILEAMPPSFPPLPSSSTVAWQLSVEDDDCENADFVRLAGVSHCDRPHVEILHSALSFLPHLRRLRILALTGLDRLRRSILSRVGRDSDAPLIAPSKEVELQRALSSLPRPRTDPFDPPEFVLAARSVHDLRMQYDRLAAEWSRNRKDDRVNRKMDKNLAAQQSALDRAFSAYLDSLGLGHSPGISYDKKAADSALRGAIGSVGSPGNHVFSYPGLRDLDLNTPSDAEAAFGIYMARKGFSVSDIRDADVKTLAALDVLTSDPGPADSRLVATFLRALKLLCPLPQVRAALKKARVPNSGKGCLERGLAGGGKRSVMLDEPCSRTLRCPDPQVPSSHQTPPVALTTIVSGGKFRTISLTSVRTEEFAFLNSFMFSKVRKCKWSIAGRTVSEWLEDEPMTGEGAFLSGDLKDATNRLSGDFARVACEYLSQAWVGEEEEVSALLRGAICDAVFVTGQPNLEFQGIQRRGQLMASDFSFPLLCLIGFAIGTETFGDTEKFLGLSEKLARRWVHEERRFGVNGDDFVARGADGDAWVAAVGKTKGEPEPTKSPFDDVFFTVNSELWKCLGGKFSRVVPLLPSMCLSLLGGYSKPADHKVLSLIKSHARSSAWFGLGLDLAFPASIPRSFGGLGAQKPHFDSVTLRQAAWTVASQVTSAIDDVTCHVSCSDYGMVRSTRTERWIASSSSITTPPSGVVGWVSRKDALESAAACFLERRITRWTVPDSAPAPLAIVQRWARNALDQNRHCKIYRSMTRAFCLEQQGYVYGVDRTVGAKALSCPPPILRSPASESRLNRWLQKVECAAGVGGRNLKPPRIRTFVPAGQVTPEVCSRTSLPNACFVPFSTALSFGTLGSMLLGFSAFGSTSPKRVTVPKYTFAGFRDLGDDDGED